MSLKATNSTQNPNKEYKITVFKWQILIKKAYKDKTVVFIADGTCHARDTEFGPFLEALSQKNIIVAAEKEILCTCEIW